MILWFSRLLFVNKTLHYLFIQQTSIQNFTGKAEICGVWDFMRKRPHGKVVGWLEYGDGAGGRRLLCTLGKVQKAETVIKK